MKRNFIATSSLVVLSLLFTAAGAYAQSAVQAHVPFAFKVGQKQVPAGTYVVAKQSNSPIIQIRNVDTGASVLAMGRRESPSSAKANKLIFRHVGDQYTLLEIWGDAEDQGVMLPAPKQHRQLEVASAPSNAGNYVEIALK